MTKNSIVCPRCRSTKTQALQCDDGKMLAIICEDCSSCVLTPMEAVTFSPHVKEASPGEYFTRAIAPIVTAPEDEALEYCVAQVLSTVKGGLYTSAVEQVTVGEGFRSPDGWELCLWSRRQMGSEVAAGFNQTAVLAWTDPKKHKFQPPYRVYDEGEFRRFMAVRVIRRMDAEGGIRGALDEINANNVPPKPDRELH